MITLKIGDCIDLATLLLAIIGGIFAFIQWNKANRIRRAEFVNELVTKMRDDKDIAIVTRKIDYDKNWYNEEFHDSKFEGKVDKTFSFFSYICYLRKINLINKKDFEFFDYEIKSLASNIDAQGYFHNLIYWTKKHKAEMPYTYLFKYCYDNGLFGNECEILNENSNRYPKFLFEEDE